MKAALAVLLVVGTLAAESISRGFGPKEKADKAVKGKSDKPGVQVRVFPEPPGGQMPPGGRVVLWSYWQGKCYRVTITQAALDKAPAWKDDAENPPLAARKA